MLVHNKSQNKMARCKDPEFEHRESDRAAFFDALERKISPKELKARVSLRHNKQWSSWSYNIIASGWLCPNDCAYCYMRPMYARFQRDMDIEDTIRSNPDKVTKGWRKVPDENSKVYMFPSSHDIFPENVGEYIAVAKKIMDANHRIVCVTKPRLECIKRICSELAAYRASFKFRFTITTDDDAVLKTWEGKSTTFAERFECLRFARSNGYETSVSMEPLLSDPTGVIAAVLPFVTDSVWIGTMSSLETMNVPEAESDRLRELYSRESLLKIVERYKTEPKIFWKTSVMCICAL